MKIYLIKNHAVCSHLFGRISYFKKINICTTVIIIICLAFGLWFSIVIFMVNCYLVAIPCVYSKFASKHPVPLFEVSSLHSYNYYSAPWLLRNSWLLVTLCMSQRTIDRALVVISTESCQATISVQRLLTISHSFYWINNITNFTLANANITILS